MKKIVFFCSFLVVSSISFSQLSDTLSNKTTIPGLPVEIIPDQPMNMRMTILSGGSLIPYEVNSHSYLYQYKSNKESKISEEKPDWTKTSLQPADMEWIITIYYQRTLKDFYKRPPPGPAAKFWDGPHGTIYGNKNLFSSALFNTLVQSSLNRRK